MNERKETTKRARSSYTLIAGDRTYKTGGYRTVKSAYDAMAYYASLVPETHRLPIYIVLGTHFINESNQLV